MSSTPTTTRSRVLTATLDLIQRAPGLISMGAIAKEAGLSRQALYLIFEDKADLFIGLLRFVDGRRGLVEEIAKIRDAPTGVDALLALVDMQARLNPSYKSVVDAIEILRRQDQRPRRLGKIGSITVWRAAAHLSGAPQRRAASAATSIKPSPLI